MRPLCVTIAASKDTSLSGKSWRKQIAYDSELFLIAPNGEPVKTPINMERMKEWHHSFQRMQQLGHTIPVPIGHTTNPKAKVAQVANLELSTDSKGRSSLFTTVVFDDDVPEKDLQAYVKADVSVFIEDWLDSETGEVREALTHLAITNKPQIPGLDKFVMALSMDEVSLNTLTKGAAVADERKISAQIQRLADRHKIDIKNAKNDDEAVAILETSLGPSLAPSASQQVEEAKEAGTGTGPVKSDPGHSSAHGSVSASRDPRYATLANTAATQIRASRETRLNSLVTGKFATPAQLEKLKTRYLDKGKISAAIEGNTIDDQNDAFDDAVAALETGGQRFGDEMSKSQLPGENKTEDLGIVVAARNRREKAKIRG